MKRSLTVLLVALLARPGASGAEGIPWQTSLQKASVRAVATNTPILIEFWATWCPPCNVMDAEVYPDPGVINAMAKVVPVRIDVDRQPDVARKYEISSMPTVVFADSFGNELFRYSGTITVPTMTQLLKELPADLRRFNELARILSRDANNFEVLESLGRELKAAKLFRSSNVYYGRAARVRTRPEQAPRRGEVLIAIGHNHLELKEFRQAAGVFERYLKDFTGSRAEAEAMLGLGRALLFQNKRAEAKRVLEMLTERYPTAPPASEAARLLSGL